MCEFFHPVAASVFLAIIYKLNEKLIDFLFVLKVHERERERERTKRESECRIS